MTEGIYSEDEVDDMLSYKDDITSVDQKLSEVDNRKVELTDQWKLSSFDLEGLTPDLNNFMGEGNYRSPNSTEPVFNNPTGLDGAFTLRVESIKDGVNYIRQTYSAYKSIQQWVRIYTLESGAWTTWVQTVTDMDELAITLADVEARLTALEAI